jgi:hypothetical protein
MSEVALTVLLQTVGTLEELNIPYVIGGSFASSFHGLLRTTNDVDIIAIIEETTIKQWIAEFETDFYLDEEMIKRAVRQKLFQYDSSRYSYQSGYIYCKAWISGKRD